MAGSSIFVTYGLKSGGGAPFLKRTRNAFGQLQSRTRTGATSTERQRRTRNCNTVTTPGTIHGDYPVYCGTFNVPQCATQSCTSSLPSGTKCAGTDFGTFGCGYDVPMAFRGVCLFFYTSFALSSFSNGTADAGCTTLNLSCNTNRTPAVRECRDVTICNFGDFTDGTDDGGCVAVDPACSNGAVIRECQTAFVFREEDGSAFEEVDECITSSPIATQGAVAVECIAN